MEALRSLFIVLAIVLLVVLPSPWDVVAFAAALALGAVEVFLWWRTVRRRRIQTGAEALIGARARVTAACRPDGEVWLDGARWRARCAEGADVDDVVTVVDRDDLLVIVAQAATAGGPAKETASADRLDR